MDDAIIQQPPYTVKVELVEGCQLRCVFCGINAIRGPLGSGDNRYHYMTAETAERIASEIARLGWRSRIEWTLHGEPLWHPEAPGLIAIFRKHLPNTSLMLTSNGGKLLGGAGAVANITALFDAGLNQLCLDDYKDVNIVPKIRTALRGANAPLTFNMYEYPADRDKNKPYSRQKPTTRTVTFFQDLVETAAAKTGARTNLSNHAGAAAPRNNRMEGKRCARPFRELAIRHDGRLRLCCDAWIDQTKIGSVHTAALDQLWAAPVLLAYRKHLYHGMRTMGECNGCDSKSWRLGLLPDSAGKQSLPEPTAEDKAIIRAALAGPPMTTPVRELM